MQRIAEDAENISVADERAAEQAAMALEFAVHCIQQGSEAGNAAEVRAAIKRTVFSQLEIPSAYNADQFCGSIEANQADALSVWRQSNWLEIFWRKFAVCIRACRVNSIES